MQVDLKNEEVDLIWNTLNTMYINRGGHFKITDEAVATAINILVKMYPAEFGELVAASNKAVERETRDKQLLEEMKHPFKTFWKSIFGKKNG